MMKSLHQAARENRMAHALLLTGDDAEKTKQAALELAQHLVCDSRATRDQGCGGCGPCLRMKALQSESLTLVQPENGVIKIDQVRPVREGLSLESWQGARVVMIESAESLNPQASNALLKVIEEPPPETHFFLLTVQPSALMSTIRSRCQLVRLGSSFSTKPSERHSDYSQEVESSLKWWQDIGEGRRVQDDEWRELVRDREGALTVVKIWADLLHQARRQAEGLETDWAEAQSVSDLLSSHPEALDYSWRALLDLKSEIEAQVDRQLATESFFLKVSARFAGSHVAS